VREGILAKFRIATPRGASFTTAGDYGYEMEALAPIDAEIFEVPSGSEDEFVSAFDTDFCLVGYARIGRLYNFLNLSVHRNSWSCRHRTSRLVHCVDSVRCLTKAKGLRGEGRWL